MDDEPVFKRTRWGTNHYELNPGNPIGLVLIVVILVLLVVMAYLMGNHIGPFGYPKHAPTPTEQGYVWTPDPPTP